MRLFFLVPLVLFSISLVCAFFVWFFNIQVIQLLVNIDFVPLQSTLPRGVIATLIRSDNRSVMLVINMIHSVTRFHSMNQTRNYPILIFHDADFTSTMRDQILSCVNQTNKHQNISFVLFDFNSTVPLSNGSQQNKPRGYRIMCRFWSRDVFFHPTVQGQYDYLMRLDADSYFAAPISDDLFSLMAWKKLDYAYRGYYKELTPALFPVEQLFLKKKAKSRLWCIYNNIFIIRLKWIYESERIQAFLHELVRDDRMIREYIGDGCAHAAMLDIDKTVKVKHLKHISYGHNYHLSRKGTYGFPFHFVEGFREEMRNACKQLTIIDMNSRKLDRIKM